MFEIKTDTRKYTIKDENSEQYFNMCMETLITAELNVEIKAVESNPAEIMNTPNPSARGGDLRDS